jgi:hypothetical protein
MRRGPTVGLSPPDSGAGWLRNISLSGTPRVRSMVVVFGLGAEVFQTAKSLRLADVSSGATTMAPSTTTRDHCRRSDTTAKRASARAMVEYE